MAGKFLIVSKKRSTVNALKKALSADRHRVLTAASGISAVDIALDQKPDAIFLGVTLTALDGLETARALRSLTPFPLVYFIIYPSFLRILIAISFISSVIGKSLLIANHTLGPSTSYFSPRQAAATITDRLRYKCL